VIHIRYIRWHRVVVCSVFLLAFSSSITFAEQIKAVPVVKAPLSAKTRTLQSRNGILTEVPEIPNGQGETITPAISEVSKPESGRSLIEQYVSGNVSQEVSTDIRQFAYDLFEEPPSTFIPIENVPVGPDYVIGPGDEIRISLWGNVEGTWTIVVDRDGNVILPKIGIRGVTGLTFKELRAFLYNVFSQYYSGFEMNITMGALRTIQVYVVGSARKPGTYTISSLSTLVNALFETGGPSKTGSMRDIQVKRNGNTIVHFDVYDFLIKGDKSEDIRLMPEDVIFIPPAGEHASIAGSVRNPAIYELKGETTALDLIMMAGGLSDIAFIGRLQVERIVDRSQQEVFETDISQAASLKLQGGDIVKIFPVTEDKRVVRISGAIHRPGEYGFSPGMTLKDLVSYSGGLEYYAFDEVAELTRIRVTREGPVTERIGINLKKALQGEKESNLSLMDNDYLFVRAIPGWKLYRTVNISGEVRFPGDYTIEKGETLSSLIERAGGFTDEAYLEGAVFTRESVRKRQQEVINEMVNRLEMEFMSMGVTETAVAPTAEAAKIEKVEMEQKRRFIETMRAVKAKGRVIVRLLPPAELKETSYDITLEDGDSIHIPEDTKIVNVAGSVYNQNSFIYDKDMDVDDYIKLSGGYTDNADKRKVYIIKANGSAVRGDNGFGSLSWNSDKNRWEAGSHDVESGDTIIVPEKLERVAWLRETKDFTQILYQIAVTAGVIIVAF
jgi:polysaccharide export outer membrane protein